MKKKLILAIAGAFSILALGACSSSGDTIATMKGGKINVSDFYSEAKTDSSNQSLVRNMIITKVFENAYGDKVKQSAIDKQYNSQKKTYGSTFESQLKAAGYTTKSYKEAIKQNLAVEAGLRSYVKLTDADYKTAWKAYHPEVSAQIITASSEDDAKDLLTQVKADGADFAKIAKKSSTDTTTASDGGKVKFDSTSTTIPTDVQTAAFKLKNGDVSDVISVTDSSTYQTTYYIVKMVKTSSKGNDMSKYKSTLKTIATETKLNDSTFTTKVIGKELKKANVKIKDDTFSTILDTYTSTSSTSSSSSKKKSSSSTKKSSSSTSSSDSSSTSTTSDSSSTTSDSSSSESSSSAE